MAAVQLDRSVFRQNELFTEQKRLPTTSAFAIAWLDNRTIGGKSFFNFSFGRHFAVGH
jgi:hypothetical protein